MLCTCLLGCLCAHPYCEGCDLIVFVIQQLHIRPILLAVEIRTQDNQPQLGKFVPLTINFLLNSFSIAGAAIDADSRCAALTSVDETTHPPSTYKILFGREGWACAPPRIVPLHRRKKQSWFWWLRTQEHAHRGFPQEPYLKPRTCIRVGLLKVIELFCEDSVQGDLLFLAAQFTCLLRNVHSSAWISSCLRINFLKFHLLIHTHN